MMQRDSNRNDVMLRIRSVFWNNRAFATEALFAGTLPRRGRDHEVSDPHDAATEIPFYGRDYRLIIPTWEFAQIIETVPDGGRIPNYTLRVARFAYDCEHEVLFIVGLPKVYLGDHRELHVEMNCINLRSLATLERSHGEHYDR